MMSVAVKFFVLFLWEQRSNSVYSIYMLPFKWPQVLMGASALQVNDQTTEKPRNSIRYVSPCCGFCMSNYDQIEQKTDHIFLCNYE